MNVTPERDGAGAWHLAEELAALPVTVESVALQAFGVVTADYPGGLRPTALVTLGGRGHLGRGEHVAFDDAAQRRFASSNEAELLVARSGAVGTLLAPLDALAPDEARWQRAALEGALIDLALRQRSTEPARQSLRALIDEEKIAGSRGGALRFVVSFEATADPAARLRALQARAPSARFNQASTPSVRFKVDVDPAWSEGAIEALVATEAVEVLDFKARGDASVAARIARRFPEALVEDPPQGADIDPHRVVRDIGIWTLEDVSAAVALGHGVNLKAPRMGGVLTALDALAIALDAGVVAYWGGMFEVGVGRRQARQLASLFTPRAGNDLGPIEAVDLPWIASASPAAVRAPLGVGEATDSAPSSGDTIRASIDRPGFGG